MLKKTLIATATAGLIAAGSLAASTGAASASGFYVGGPNFSFGFNSPSFVPRPHKVCQPVFRTVQWWKFGRMHTSVVKVGEKCFWTGGNRGRFPGPFPGQFQGPHPGPWAWQQHPW